MKLLPLTSTKPPEGLAHHRRLHFLLALACASIIACGSIGCGGRPQKEAAQGPRPERGVRNSQSPADAARPPANTAKPQAETAKPRAEAAKPQAETAKPSASRAPAPAPPHAKKPQPEPPKPTGGAVSREPSKPKGLAAGSPRALPSDEEATVRLFAAASPSVVHITTDELEQDFFSLNTLEVPKGTGSGIIWDKKGHVVTNFHVVQGADAVRVALSDNSVWPAKLVGTAPSKDLAVLKISAPAGRLRPLPLGTSHDLEVGQKTLAIGNPFGLDHTLTTGVVSALGRELESPNGRTLKDVIQTDAAINPGNSGGPLLDSSGRLIGVTSAIYSPSGAYAGIGFAIPVDTLRWVVPELIAHGKIIRPGLAIAVAPDAWVDRLGLSGVLVLSVKKGSAAAQAGLRPTRRDSSGQIHLGDVITAVGDTPVQSTSDLLSAFEHHKPGDVVRLTVMRDKQKVTLRVPLTRS